MSLFYLRMRTLNYWIGTQDGSNNFDWDLICLLGNVILTQINDEFWHMTFIAQTSAHYWYRFCLRLIICVFCSFLTKKKIPSKKNVFSSPQKKSYQMWTRPISISIVWAITVVRGSSWNFPARASSSYECSEPSLGTLIFELKPSWQFRQ